MIIDPRFTQLAEGLTRFSTGLKKGERVLIDAFDIPDAMLIALIRATRARGAFPYVQIHRARVTRELSLGAEEAQFAPHADVELVRMQKMDAYIALRGSGNIFEVSDVPSDRVQLVSRLMKPVLDYRVGRTKWVVLRWPTSAMAQQAAMSTLFRRFAEAAAFDAASQTEASTIRSSAAKSQSAARAFSALAGV